MDAGELVALLRAKVRQEGSALRFAMKHELSQGYVLNVMCGYSKPGPKIALALGLKPVRSFEPIK